MRQQSLRERPYRPPIPTLRIFRRFGESKAFVGLVDAPDRVKAIELAIRTFQITNPEHQKHLMAEAGIELRGLASSQGHFVNFTAQQKFSEFRGDLREVADRYRPRAF
jgi:hypothetical protein